MSDGVEMTSYLGGRLACHISMQRGRDIQLDDVGVSQCAHVLDLALDSCLCPVLRDSVLRDVLHGHLLTGHGMHGNYPLPRKTEGDRWNARGWHADSLFTFPNVPSAISPITVYSPSLFAGNLYGESSAMMVCRQSGRDGNPGQDDERYLGERWCSLRVPRGAYTRLGRAGRLNLRAVYRVEPRWKQPLLAKASSFEPFPVVIQTTQRPLHE